VSCVSVAMAGTLLAEVLANRRAYGGAAMRLAATIVSVVVGASTAIFDPASVPAIAIAAISVPVVWAFSRLGVSPVPAKEPAA